ncbi:oligoendopeptidase F [Atopococcus tabaci]|uniref:oligoendopeptidase F n=1 Tax=Atopococcus tabaci TaxID=269774 RepID=UPI0024092BF7|nr:oligoendopeptidase F [Atopococcus tabaci]
MEAQAMKHRSEVTEALTWDLTALFENKREFEETVQELQAKADTFTQQYDGNIKDAASMIEAIKDYEQIRKLATWIGQYATLPTNTDITDGEAMERARYIRNVLAGVSAKLSFFDSQLTANEEAVLDEVAQQAPEYAAFIRRVKKQKAVQLEPEVEKALAQLSPVFGAPQQIFEQARSNDMDFGTFTANGKEYPLSFVLYEEVYMYHPDTEVRRAAFDQFSQVLEKYQNVVASAYYTQVQKEKTMATMRGFDSVFDYLLMDQEVDRELYDRQIDTLMNDFAPVMRKFITHVKELNGLDKMTYADLKIDLDPEYSPTITIEESKDLVKETLQPLGQEYVDMILRAYPERWIDFPQNKGKRSGAFCSTTYEKHPYILVSWTDQLSDAYTLLHELGHAGQGLLSNANRSLLASRPSLYLIEAPSTFHELLLTDYLKKHTEDPRMERSVLSKMISKTYFHNFVTHLLEAAYQREVYKLVDAGKGFDAAKLSEIKRSVLEQFWGDAVEINPGAELTWMRQIHYYMGLYPYTYSAGLTIATQAFLKMKEEGPSMVDNWHEFLALGGELIPVEAAKVAGVDITTDKPLSDTIHYLDKSVDKIIELSAQIS